MENGQICVKCVVKRVWIELNKPTKCRYCGNKVVYTSNAEIYGREYGNGMVYLCRNCGAYVGTHPNSDRPLGTLANAELREYRKQAHFWFDQIWKTPNKIMSRWKAYDWLSKQLGLPKEKTHIGMFEKNECIKVIKLAKERLNNE